MLASQTGLYANIQPKTRVVTESIIPLEVNSALLNDGSFKERFITLPADTVIVPTDSDKYVFPDRTVMIKNFAIDTVGTLAMAIAALATMTMTASAAAMKAPLTKTGACPELKRETFPMGDNFMGRFIATNLNGDITLKSKFGSIQTALAPQQSIDCSAVAAGFKIEQWTSELETAKIISLQNVTFDERGRVWAVETFDYPNIMAIA